MRLRKPLLRCIKPMKREHVIVTLMRCHGSHPSPRSALTMFQGSKAYGLQSVSSEQNKHWFTIFNVLWKVRASTELRHYQCLLFVLRCDIDHDRPQRKTVLYFSSLRWDKIEYSRESRRTTWYTTEYSLFVLILLCVCSCWWSHVHAQAYAHMPTVAFRCVFASFIFLFAWK